MSGGFRPSITIAFDGAKRQAVAPMDPAAIKARLLASFPDARCELVDLTGTSDHYELHIASEAFRGLPALRQHRLVYQALGGDVGTVIHALALKIYLPEAWTRSD